MNKASDFNQTFYLIQLRSRPLLAYPKATLKIHRAAIRCFPTHTKKRKLIQLFLMIVEYLGLNHWLWASVKHPLSEVDEFSLNKWFATLSNYTAESDLQPVIVWPADSERGRVYIHLLNQSGIPIAFAKLALDQINSDLIHNEKIMLEHINSMRLENISILKVLWSGRLQGYSFIEVTYAPPHSRMTNWLKDTGPDKFIHEYSGKSHKIDFTQVQNLLWWQLFEKKVYRDSDLFKSVSYAASFGVDVCLVHGDLNQTNVLRVDGKVLLLDWERSSKYGPCLTDFICTEVEKLWNLSQRSISVALTRFHEKHWDNREYNYPSSVLMALAFLYAVDFTPATVLLLHWIATKKIYPDIITSSTNET